MSKYGEARAKLTAEQKLGMDKEYQQMQSAGKTSFKSKYTGLSYAIPENSKSNKKLTQLNPITSSTSYLEN